jgi:hypothetical protein
MQYALSSLHPVSHFLTTEKKHFLNFNYIDGFLSFLMFFLQVLHPLLMVIGFILVSGEGNFGINLPMICTN